MQKHELISLANEMCKELVTIIDNQEHASKEQLANYLFESAELVMNLKEKDISSTDFAETLFHNVYRELTKKSLSSYTDTNNKIEILAQVHEDTLLECDEDNLDLPLLKSKFHEIQDAMAVEVKKANETIKYLHEQVKTLEKNSNLDGLTKVYNRRALSTYLTEVCSKEKLPNDLHALILDIDDFKKVNDTHGHLAGDKVLIFIANILRKTLRDGDRVFRYGGEEFVIILNRLDDMQCKNITNRIIGLIRNNKLVYKGVSLSVTMSIGATKFISGDTPDSLIYRADKALYKAKENGKDQMYVDLTNGI
ncbi:MAG: GGDEF domain-containing protein [Sulfurimonas sp.]|nr:GGDEF domain-containing protein [Sulfurimonas sp.]